MSCCGKGQSLQSTVVENGVKVRYIGQNVGAKAILGNDERVYRGGNNRLDRIQYLHPDDVELLKDSFAVVESPKAESSNATPLARHYTHEGAMVVNTHSNTITVAEGVTDEQAATAIASIEPLEPKSSRKRGTE